MAGQQRHADRKSQCFQRTFKNGETVRSCSESVNDENANSRSLLLFRHNDYKITAGCGNDRTPKYVRIKTVEYKPTAGIFLSIGYYFREPPELFCTYEQACNDFQNIRN